jgi:DnaK suppressor protein
MTPAAAKRALLADREVLRERLDGVQRPTASHDVGDDADVMVRVEHTETALVHRGRLVARLREIDAALARIADGTYGQCVECGEVIKDLRLEAIPEASRCTSCEAANEHRSAPVNHYLEEDFGC